MAQAETIRSRGLTTQARILERGVHIASVEGLSAMSLATLARATSMSKSGLFAHFRSKEALQIAIIDEAARMFTEAVVTSALREPVGMERLAALMMGYARYSAGMLFEGGCFFAAAAHEFDAKPGPVRDRIAAFLRDFAAMLRDTAHAAKDRGQIEADADVEHLVFEVMGVGLAGNWTAQLFGDRERALASSEQAMVRLVQRVATSTGLSAAGLTLSALGVDGSRAERLQAA